MAVAVDADTGAAVDIGKGWINRIDPIRLIGRIVMRSKATLPMRYARSSTATAATY